MVYAVLLLCAEHCAKQEVEKRENLKLLFSYYRK